MDKAWYQANKKKHGATCMAWAKRNQDRIRVIQKRYRDSHKEADRAYEKRYRITASGVFVNLRKRHRNPVTITKEAFTSWYDNTPKMCFYCGVPESRIGEFPELFHGTINRRLSVDRMDNTRGYEIGNMVLACRRCNGIKSDFFSVEEMKEIGRLFVRPKWENK